MEMMNVREQNIISTQFSVFFSFAVTAKKLK